MSTALSTSSSHPRFLTGSFVFVFFLLVSSDLLSCFSSMATLIGLCLRVKLMRSLPARFKISININPGTHASEKAVNKQLNDKERVHAALENERLLSTVQQCLTEKEKE